MHLLITEHGQSVEFFLTPGSYSDTSALKGYLFELLESSIVTSGKAYIDYDAKDVMNEVIVYLWPLRKKNCLHPMPPGFKYLMSACRKMIETTRMIESLLPMHIHAITDQGFELKVARFS